MAFKPTIFIGSSTEGLSIAKKIYSSFRFIGECKMWDKAFNYNQSNFDNLISKIAFYDYAILIATADDVVTSRKKTFDSGRDNVLFEFGLFAGGLGKNKVYYFIEEGIKIPSDLSGVCLPHFFKRTKTGFDKSFNITVSQIKKDIIGNENTFNLGFLPSTTLAYGYFINFVEKTVERLLEDKAEGKLFNLQNNMTFSIKKFKFTVLIPDDLTDDMFKKVKAKRLKGGWQKLKVDPKDVRDYDFSIDVSKISSGLLHLVDIPFTLNALNLSIELYSKKEHIGKNSQNTLLEHREIRNFVRTLDYLIGKSSVTRGLVKIEIVKI